MKKLILISIAMMLSCSIFSQNKPNEQKEGTATVILTAGDVFGDGTGYQLLLDSDAATSENLYEETMQLGYVAIGYSYIQYEYTLPEGADGNGNNIVFNSSASITIPAGTYDYVVMNPSSNKIWIANQFGTNSTLESGYVFEAGKTYIFAMSKLGTNDNLTITILDENSDATIFKSVNNLSLSAKVGESTNGGVSVFGFGFSESLNISTTAPFSISTDANSYSSNVTLPSNGGDIYIKYSPTVEGTDNNTIIISAGTLSDTISLTGFAYDCFSTLSNPYVETFPFNETSEYCWTIIDANNDGYTFSPVYANSEHSDMSYSIRWNKNLAANDWLISPKLRIAENDEINFSYMARQNGDYVSTEKFSVWIIRDSQDNYESGTQILATTAVECDNSAWKNMSINMTNYAGQEFYVGIKCESDMDQYRFDVNDFTLRTRTSIDENQSETISLYPNPANNSITVQGVANEKIEILNIVGKVVKTIENATENQHIDISNLENGTYFIHANSSVMKFIIVK